MVVETVAARLGVRLDDGLGVEVEVEVVGG